MKTSRRLNGALIAAAAMLMATDAFESNEWVEPKVLTPNKFRRPHQGKRECARRVQQMSGTPLESKPRRMWVMNGVSEKLFGKIQSSSRKPLAKHLFHRIANTPLVLLP